MYRKLLLCFLWLAVSGFYALDSRKPTIFLVGDSTVSTFAERYAPMTGWGHTFHQYFTDEVTVDNRAIAGKSSRSFIEEGKWARVIRDIQKGDYLFIQFGHNDQKRDHRYTSPYNTYKNFLTQYISETRGKGGIPILVTSVMRRRFRNGELYDTHGDYPKAVRQLANELDVPLVDLHQRSFAHFDELGEEATKKIFLWLEPGEERNYPRGLEDNTHFSRYGAKEVGKLVVAGLKTLDLSLKNYLKDYRPPPCEEEETETITLCQGEGVSIGGHYRTQSGTYREDMGTVEGCRKTRVVSLTVNPTSASSRTITLCEGESQVLGGKTRRTSGTYYDTYRNRWGCDSVVTTRLIVNPVYETRRTLTVCQGDSVRIGDRFRAAAGTYRHVYQSQQGCDSTVISQLVVRPTRVKRINRAICQGDSIKIGSQFFSKAGRYRRIYNTRYGCDSTVITTLRIIPTRFHERSLVIAEGDSIQLGGYYRFQRGTYYDTLQSTLGCDSIITTALRVIPSPTETQLTTTLCHGDSLLVGGSYQKESGVFYDTLMLTTGAKDIVTTTLEVLPRYQQAQTIALCQGGSITLRGTLRTQPGVYYDTLASSTGCDSVIVTTLQIADSIATPTITADQDTLRSSVLGDTYRWFLNEQLLADTTAAIAPPQEGNYAVVVGTGDCISLPSVAYYYTPVVTGTYDLPSSEASLQVYRGEEGNYLHIAVLLSTKGSSRRDGHLYIHDLLGNSVYSGGTLGLVEKIPFVHSEGIYVVTLVEPSLNRRTSLKFYW